MNNRYGVTLRFNQAEQKDLRTLMEFWKRSEKDVLKQAFLQFVIATNQLNKKLTDEANAKAAEKAAATEEQQCEPQSTESSSSSSQESQQAV